MHRWAGARPTCARFMCVSIAVREGLQLHHANTAVAGHESSMRKHLPRLGSVIVCGRLTPGVSHRVFHIRGLITMTIRGVTIRDGR